MGFTRKRISFFLKNTQAQTGKMLDVVRVFVYKVLLYPQEGRKAQIWFARAFVLLLQGRVLSSLSYLLCRAACGLSPARGACPCWAHTAHPKHTQWQPKRQQAHTETLWSSGKTFYCESNWALEPSEVLESPPREILKSHLHSPGQHCLGDPAEQ